MAVSPVLVIGSGLLGASIGLRLKELGSQVYLEDASPVALGLARDLGAGELANTNTPEPALVIVAVPPDVTAAVVAEALERFPHAIVSDVASVKSLIVEEISTHPQASRYVGSHPMAGRERSGAVAADADLFAGRPWVLTPSEHTADETLHMLQNLALDVGALPVVMSPAEHDKSVALVSHMPQLVSSLVAGALREAPEESLSLAGQGLRDVTRIAHSDSALWASIIAGNAPAVRESLISVAGELARLIEALEPAHTEPFAPGVLLGVARAVKRGNEGVERIPGKHGGAPRRYGEVIVLVPDTAGALGELFADIGEAGINIEDLQIEHSAGQPVGRVALAVQPARVRPLVLALESKGYRVIVDGKASETMPLVIAIDGPSGSGKSTVSKQVARELSLAYLDTGAMYRCATWWVVREGIDLDDESAVADAVKRMPLDMPLDPDNQTIICDGVDITQEIRSPEITRVVSKVAANMQVREELIRRQREIIASARTGIIAEGRDITSVVAPDATVRAIITASEEARLARRSLEVRGSADKDAVEATKDEVLRRDSDDLKVNDFMTAKDGVTLIDSSYLGIDEVVSAVIALVPEE